MRYIRYANESGRDTRTRLIDIVKKYNRVRAEPFLHIGRTNISYAEGIFHRVAISSAWKADFIVGQNIVLPYKSQFVAVILRLFERQNDTKKERRGRRSLQCVAKQRHHSH